MDRFRPPSFEPRLAFPITSSSLNSPIIVNVVAGQMALLECVTSTGKVVWEKVGFPEHAVDLLILQVNSTLAPIMLTDDRARIRQIWGNLRIRSVSFGDAGIYICHGVSSLNSDDVVGKEHPRAFYRLSVHAATSVRLQLEQLVADKSWQV